MLYFSNMRLYICVLRICVVVPILYLLFFNAAKPGVQGVFCFLPRPGALGNKFCIDGPFYFSRQCD